MSSVSPCQTSNTCESGPCTWISSELRTLTDYSYLSTSGYASTSLPVNAHQTRVSGLSLRQLIHFDFESAENIIQTAIMDVDHPDHLRRLRLILQIALAAMCDAAGLALHLLLVLTCGFSHDSDPESMIGFVNSFYATSVFTTNLYPLFQAVVILPARMADDFEMEYERSFSMRRKLLLTGLRVLPFSSVLYGLLDLRLIQSPLSMISSSPNCPLRCVYALLGIIFIEAVTGPPSVGSYTASLAAGIVDVVSHPYKAWLRSRRRGQSKTFLLDPGQRRASFKPFQYQELSGTNAFRLLKLEPTDQGMSVQLEHYRIDRCPPYWAVSYVWGSSAMPHSLILDQDTGSQIPLTESCAKVLKLLTPLQATRYLWIDSICIDQTNVREKEHQIPLMADIYSKAEQVVGCLGVEQDLPLSPYFLFMILRYLRSHGLNTAAHPLYLPVLTRLRDWAAFVFLLTNPYWQRAWIVQEIILAKKLIFIYGEACFSWDQYHMAVTGLSRMIVDGRIPNIAEIQAHIPVLHGLVANATDQLEKISSLKHNLALHPHTQDRLSLPQILHRLYIVQATQRRDQLYALLNFSSDRHSPALQPRCDPAVTDTTIFTDATLHYLRRGDLGLLLLAGLGYDDDDGAAPPRPPFPTWVPVLPLPVRLRLGNAAAAAAAATRARSGVHRLDMAASADAREPSLRGARVDAVAVLSGGVDGCAARAAGREVPRRAPGGERRRRAAGRVRRRGAGHVPGLCGACGRGVQAREGARPRAVPGRDGAGGGDCAGCVYGLGRRCGRWSGWCG